MSYFQVHTDCDHSPMTDCNCDSCADQRARTNGIPGTGFDPSTGQYDLCIMIECCEMAAQTYGDHGCNPPAFEEDLGVVLRDRRETAASIRSFHLGQWWGGVTDDNGIYERRRVMIELAHQIDLAQSACRASEVIFENWTWDFEFLPELMLHGFEARDEVDGYDSHAVCVIVHKLFVHCFRQVREWIEGCPDKAHNPDGIRQLLDNVRCMSYDSEVYTNA